MAKWARDRGNATGRRHIKYYDAECSPCGCSYNVGWNIPTIVAITKGRSPYVEETECAHCGMRWAPPSGQEWYQGDECRVITERRV